MVDVGVVRVTVDELGMLVRMRVWLVRRYPRTVLVPVVLVVGVAVPVPRGLMHVIVLVSLGQMQPESHAHQRRRSQKPPGHCFPKEQQSGTRPDEGRKGEVGAGARGTERSHCQHKANEAHPVPHEAHGQSPAEGRSRGQRATQYEPKPQVHGARHEPFEPGDLDWIACRDSLREVAVNRPPETGCGHQQRANGFTRSHRA